MFVVALFTVMSDGSVALIECVVTFVFNDEPEMRFNGIQLPDCYCSKPRVYRQRGSVVDPRKYVCFLPPSRLHRLGPIAIWVCLYLVFVDR